MTIKKGGYVDNYSLKFLFHILLDLMLQSQNIRLAKCYLPVNSRKSDLVEYISIQDLFHQQSLANGILHSRGEIFVLYSYVLFSCTYCRY